MSRSAAALAIRLSCEPGRNLTENILPRCRVSTDLISLCWDGFQMLSFKSSEPDARRVPASLQSRQLTQPSCPFSSVSRLRWSILFLENRKRLRNSELKEGLK